MRKQVLLNSSQNTSS